MPADETPVEDPELRCPNTKCICNNEHAPHRFRRTKNGLLRCWYCDSKVR